ncbi:MAG TPA: hypothetical protein VFM04_06505 [Candidatus Methylomirabilis sp.]|nr:hypothetical protein [Candidatus Methylomirabilis sp.]
MNWKVVARKWLIFVGCLLVALTFNIISVVLEEKPPFLILITFVIYAIVQIVRSTIWTIRMVRKA